MKIDENYSEFLRAGIFVSFGQMNGASVENRLFLSLLKAIKFFRVS